MLVFNQISKLIRLNLGVKETQVQKSFPRVIIFFQLESIRLKRLRLKWTFATRLVLGCAGIENSGLDILDFCFLRWNAFVSLHELYRLQLGVLYCPVSSTFSYEHCAQQPMPEKKFGSRDIWTRGCRMRSANTTSGLCRPYVFIAYEWIKVEHTMGRQAGFWTGNNFSCW